MPHCRTDVQSLTWEEGPAAPCRAAAWPPPGVKMRLKINFIYIQVPTARQQGGRGPAAPQPGGRGTKL